MRLLSHVPSYHISIPASQLPGPQEHTQKMPTKDLGRGHKACGHWEDVDGPMPYCKLQQHIRTSSPCSTGTSSQDAAH